VAAGANGAVTVSDVDSWSSAIVASNVLLLQFELPPEVVLRAARVAHDAGVMVVVNPSPFAAPPSRLLAAADVLVVNEGEAAALGDARVSTVVTRGAGGASWGDIAVAAKAAEVVDTTGAGDAFAGALAARLADGASRRDALEAAVAAGASCVAHDGAQGWFFG
ncbi:MAG TPA: PfkB family carbohydrate kinase, partial [Stackebrandtia sp.]|uniref:PfkB family carbohydrate kinase n=1 Tax=Stackebrandtia sp. TaxID=2023065 RepID=UPI002D28AB0C